MHSSMDRIATTAISSTRVNAEFPFFFMSFFLILHFLSYAADNGSLYHICGLISRLNLALPGIAVIIGLIDLTVYLAFPVGAVILFVIMVLL